MGGAERYSLARYSIPGAENVEMSAVFSEELGGVVRTTNFWGGKGRYSLLRYSVNLAKKSIPISAAFSETLNTVTGPAVKVKFTGRFSENVQGSIQGTLSIVTDLSESSGLYTAAKMSADVITAETMIGAMQAAVYGQKDMPASLDAGDILSASIWGAKNIPAYLPLTDAMTARTAGSKNVPSLFVVSEILTSMLEATSQTTERATVQLAIPPGGELRIDSELFIVLLNGENALHTQSGDWINISRNLLRLIVESASGGQLRGQLIYTERYL